MSELRGPTTEELRARVLAQSEAGPTRAETFPAAVLVRWPSGPVPACNDHARMLVNLGGDVLGFHVSVTPLLEPAECPNCRNDPARPPLDSEGAERQ